LIVFGGTAFVTDEDIAMYEKVASISNWSRKVREPLEAIYGIDALQSMWTKACDAWKRMHKTDGGNILVDRLPGIRAKTLVLHGRKDPLVPEWHAEYMHERISHSTLRVFEEGKHDFHLRFPDDVNAAITDFLLEEDDREQSSREFVAVPTKYTKEQSATKRSC
jgi:valacyclovir hydrolase